MGYYEALAPYYDAFMEEFPYADYAALCDRVFRSAGKPVRAVLDLACGTGTLSCMLAEMGYDVVACDASAEMLWQAMQKREGDNPLFICQEMAELDLFGTVNAAVCSLDGISHLPPEELLPVFQKVRLFMEEGGVFLFDINTEEKLRSQDGASFTDECEGALCVWRAVFEDGRADFLTDLFVEEDDGLWRRESAEHSEFVHSTEQIEMTLLQAGFSSAQRLDAALPDSSGREFWLAKC